MTTPNGGAYSTVVAMLKGVAIDDPALADYLEIHEHAEDGTVIATTYAGTIVERPSDLLFSPSVDQSEANDPERADAMKLSWDIYGHDHKLITTLDGLLITLGMGYNPEGFEAVSNMTALPVWDLAPAGLRTEVETWLSGA